MKKRKPYRKSLPIETDCLCSVGCGNIAKFKSPGGVLLCSPSANSCPIQKEKNSKGLFKCYENGRDAKKIWANMSNESKDKCAWNKGLTKEIDNRVARPQFIGKKFASALSGHTQETKNKLSEARIKFLENSPHIEWKKITNGIKVQGEWEYNVGEKLLELGYSVTRIQLKYDNHRRYTPDFCIEKDVFVEVKGWLSDNDIKKYKLVYADHPNIKIYLIRNEKQLYNYTRFISGEISLFECEDLKIAIGS
jgi:hypothetical protein